MATVQIYDTRQNRVVTVEKIEKSDAEWKKLLTKEQYERMKKMEGLNCDSIPATREKKHQRLS